MASGVEDTQEAAGQTGDGDRMEQSMATMDTPATADCQGHTSEGTGLPQNTDDSDKALHGPKRPLDGEGPGPDSQAKKRRSPVGQANPRAKKKKAEENGAAAQPQGNSGLGANAQPSAGAGAREAPGAEDAAGGGVKEEEADAEGFIAGGLVRRPAQEVADCLACDLCRSILRDAITAPECMHSYCRECLEAELVGSLGGNICPACARDGERTLLGANPFAYHRLQPDFVLEALVRKIFPRHILEEYDKRRPKYSPLRLGQIAGEPGTRPSRARGQQMPPADVVPLFLQHKSEGDGEGCGKQLDMPYLRVPKALPVAVLAKYVAQKVTEPAEAQIQLFYKDTALSEGQTIHEAAEACMPRDNSGSALLELCYMVVQVAQQHSSVAEEVDGGPAKQAQLAT